MRVSVCVRVCVRVCACKCVCVWRRREEDSGPGYCTGGSSQLSCRTPVQRFWLKLNKTGSQKIEAQTRQYCCYFTKFQMQCSQILWPSFAMNLMPHVHEVESTNTWMPMIAAALCGLSEVGSGRSQTTSARCDQVSSTDFLSAHCTQFWELHKN